MDVQADLINMGYLAYGLPMSQWHTEADGIFGPKTHAAVVAFQRSITGQAGTGILTEPQAQIADAEARRIASGQPTTSRHPRSQLSDGQPVKPGASSAPTSLFTRALVGVAVGVGAAILFSD